MLPYNTFLQQIYSLINIWIIIVGIITFASLLKWLYCLIYPKIHYNYIENYIRTLKPKNQISSLKLFKSTLSRNGIFVINLIAVNCGNVVAAQIVRELLNMFEIEMEENLKEIKYVSNSLKRNFYELNDEII